jgi:hypothetical protein
MGSAVATATDVSRSRSSHPEDAIKIDASTNHFGSVLVVIEDFTKTDHSASDSPSEG